MTLNSTIVVTNGSSGSGTGTLTSADPHSKSISVEIDRIVMPYEKNTFNKDLNTNLLHSDYIMKLPTHESAFPIRLCNFYSSNQLDTSLQPIQPTRLTRAFPNSELTEKFDWLINATSWLP
jgi:hypothetical protein